MNTRDIVYIALFAAVYAALGLFPPITLPLIGVPITAQSMGPMLAGSVLGAKRGALASVLFLLLVIVGLPLLAGGRGGFGVFLGPGGGYLVAYPIAAFFIGYAFERLWHGINFAQALIINIIGGVGIVHLVGIPWLSVVAGLSVTQAAIGSAGFVPGDVIKALIASFIGITVRKSYPIITSQK